MASTAIKSVREALGGDTFPLCESPSLRLEKFVRIGGNTKREEIESVITCQRKNGKAIPSLSPKGAIQFEAKLESNLIVNQAGGVLENAGLCLHSHFGTPYIPGSAVKGIARHAAWCAWSEEKDPEKKVAIAREIADIFGYPTGDKKGKNDPDTREYLDDFLATHGHKTVTSGTVAFLNATAKPLLDVRKQRMGELAVDILTPHGGNDWTEPIPSPFPVVKKETKFLFTLVPGREKNLELLAKAERYLKVGLTQHGIGAKTAAGYGAFSIPEITEATPNSKKYRLTLSSPAFLKGANSDSEGILRESSLRGLMRWWWRYLYRSIFPENELKRLETFIWGGAGETPTASKIGVRIVKSPRFPRAIPYSKRAKTEEIGIFYGFDQEHTSGISYITYGMDDGNSHRKVVEPAQQFQWEVELFTRNENNISSAQLLIHGELALLALCKWGGIGAKARKGFGSFSCDQALPDIKDLFGKMYESVANLGFRDDTDVEQPYSMSKQLETTIDVSLTNSWAVLDRIGYALQLVAISYKHSEDKAVLGLPRKIHGPQNRRMGHQHGFWNPPQILNADGPMRGVSRFTMPICVHLDKLSNGYRVNILYFPSAYVRKYDTSEAVLGEVKDMIEEVLGEYEIQKIENEE